MSSRLVIMAMAAYPNYLNSDSSLVMLITAVVAKVIIILAGITSPMSIYLLYIYIMSDVYLSVIYIYIYNVNPGLKTIVITN